MNCPTDPPTEPVPMLNALTLPQLERLFYNLREIAWAAGPIAHLKPVFDLTPGEVPVMRVTGLKIPGLAAELRFCGEPMAQQLGRLLAEQAADVADEELADRLAMAMAAELEDAAPTSPVPDVKAFVDQVFAEIDASSAPVVAATGAVEPVPGLVGDSPGAMAKGGALRQPFSAYENAVIVREMRQAQRDGMPKSVGIRAAAAVLVGRSEKSINAHYYANLRGDVETPSSGEQTANLLPAALEDGGGVAAGDQQHPAPPAATEAKPELAPRPVVRAVAVVVPEAVAPAMAAPKDVPEALRPVAAHLRTVKPFAKWTPALDRELIRLAEEARWQLHEICLDLQVSSAQAQQRFSVLTKAQAFRRAEVWEAMQATGYGLGNLA